MQITIYGAGSWGTAMASMLLRKSHQVNLWSHRTEQVAQLQADGENKVYLPGIALPPSLQITNEISIGKDSQMIILAVPSSAVKEVAAQISPYIKDDAIIVNLAKGFYPDNQKLLSQVIKQELSQHQVLTLSGPSHAEEAARDLPTTVVIAGEKMELLQEAQGCLYEQ